MKAYAGIDLHSSNNYLGIINDNDKRLYGRRIPAGDENESSIPQVFILDCKNTDMKNLWTGVQGLNCSNASRCLCVLCNAMADSEFEKKPWIAAYGAYFIITIPWG